MPAISVVMSCHNSEFYLRESIESILTQTFTDYEFIIWNDGSTDDTEKIIKSYNDTRIRYFSAKNQGLGKALHEACLKAEGEYIVRMDDDDISMPDRLEVEYNFMQKHSRCVLASCAVYYIDEDGNNVGFSAPALSDHVLKRTFSFVHPGVIFRRDVYLKTKGYLNLKTAQDNVLWQFFTEYGEFRNINTILLKYRVRRNSIVRNQRIKELSECCAKLRQSIVEESKKNNDVAELLVIHNKIYDLNKDMSRNLPPMSDHQNRKLALMTKSLSLFLSDKNASKTLSWITTIYKSIVL